MNKLLYGLKKPLKFNYSYKFLFIMLVYIIYNILIEWFDIVIIDENSTPSISEIPLYCSLIIVPYLCFCYTFFKNIVKIKNIRFIIFPITFFLVIMCGFMSVACFTGGAIYWALITVFIPFCIFLVLSLIIGLIYDIKDWIKFFKESDI